MGGGGQAHSLPVFFLDILLLSRDGFFYFFYWFTAKIISFFKFLYLGDAGAAALTAFRQEAADKTE